MLRGPLRHLWNTVQIQVNEENLDTSTTYLPGLRCELFYVPWLDLWYLFVPLR